MSSRPLDGRWLAAAVVGAYALLAALTAHAWGIGPALSAAGVPSVGAPFSDLYVFPAAAAEFSRGGNPYVRNDADPWRRTYNYPRAWLLFMRYPYAAVPWLGFGIAAAWLATLGAVWGRLSPGQGLLAGGLACSPPVALALERGNSDLLIFIGIAAAIGCLQRGWRAPAWVILLGGALLKLYPIVAFAAFFGAGGRRARGWVAAAALGFALWVGLHADEFRAIAHNTPMGGPAISYGSTVVFSIAEKLHGDRTGEWGAYVGEAWLGSVGAACLAAGMGGAGWWRGRQRARTGGPPVPTLDQARIGFQAGAAVYVATFVLGSNFAYRYIFLLFCLPWLWRRRDEAPMAGWRRAAAAALVVSLWSNPMWWIPLIALREVSDWTLFATLAWLLGASLAGAPRGQRFSDSPEGRAASS
jgi:hypothetical protein